MQAALYAWSPRSLPADPSRCPFAVVVHVQDSPLDGGPADSAAADSAEHCRICFWRVPSIPARVRACSSPGPGHDAPPATSPRLRSGPEEGRLIELMCDCRGDLRWVHSACAGRGHPNPEEGLWETCGFGHPQRTRPAVGLP